MLKVVYKDSVDFIEKSWELEEFDIVSSGMEYQAIELISRALIDLGIEQDKINMALIDYVNTIENFEISPIQIDLDEVGSKYIVDNHVKNKYDIN